MKCVGGEINNVALPLYFEIYLFFFEANNDPPNKIGWFAKFYFFLYRL